MAVPAFTHDDLRGMLLAVGADPDVAAPDYVRSLEDLGLDSLARMEIASRIKDRYGFDIEEDLAPATTPSGLRELVNERLASEARGVPA